MTPLQELYIRWFGVGWPEPEDIHALHDDLFALAFEEGSE